MAQTGSHGADDGPQNDEQAPLIDVTSLDLGGDVVFVTDREGTIVDVNDAFVRVTGYSRREAIGSTPRLLSSGYQDDDFYRELWETITDGRVWEGQLIDRRRDGALRTHHATITPVRDRGGRITHFVAVERDVTSELGRQVAVGSAGLLHTDVGGRCVYADGRAAALLNRPPTSLLGDGLLQALVPEDAQAFRELIQMATEEGRDHRMDLRSREDEWFHVEVAPLTVPSGVTIGAVCAIEDVGEQLSVHRELARRDAFLTSVLDALDDPIAVIAHDGTVLAVNAAWRHASEDRSNDPLLAARVGHDLHTRLEVAAEDGNQHAASVRKRLERFQMGVERAERHPDDPLRLSPLQWDEGGVVLRLDRS